MKCPWMWDMPSYVKGERKYPGISSLKDIWYNKEVGKSFLCLLHWVPSTSKGRNLIETTVSDSLHIFFMWNWHLIPSAAWRSFSDNNWTRHQSLLRIFENLWMSLENISSIYLFLLEACSFLKWECRGSGSRAVYQWQFLFLWSNTMTTESFILKIHTVSEIWYIFIMAGRGDIQPDMELEN